VVGGQSGSNLRVGVNGGLCGSSVRLGKGLVVLREGVVWGATLIITLRRVTKWREQGIGGQGGYR
jgi:hypothetical protein